jgi:hypothetical protein
MPVDYWDYLGWKDTLASAKFTARQREYAAHRGDGQIYTPQIVVDGAARVVGSDRATVDKAVTSAVSRCKSSPITIGLSMGRTTMQIALDIGPTAPATELEGTVWVAVVRPEVPVAIQRGENRGKTVIYHNVVRELIPVGLWSGGSARLKLDRSAIMTSPGERSAVIVQQGKGGPIIAGGWFESPSHHPGVGLRGAARRSGWGPVPTNVTASDPLASHPDGARGSRRDPTEASAGRTSCAQSPGTCQRRQKQRL